MASNFSNIHKKISLQLLTLNLAAWGLGFLLAYPIGYLVMWTSYWSYIFLIIYGFYLLLFLIYFIVARSPYASVKSVLIGSWWMYITVFAQSIFFNVEVVSFKNPDELTLYLNQHRQELPCYAQLDQIPFGDVTYIEDENFDSLGDYEDSNYEYLVEIENQHSLLFLRNWVSGVVGLSYHLDGMRTKIQTLKIWTSKVIKTPAIQGILRSLTQTVSQKNSTSTPTKNNPIQHTYIAFPSYLDVTLWKTILRFLLIIFVLIANISNLPIFELNKEGCFSLGYLSEKDSNARFLFWASFIFLLCCFLIVYGLVFPYS